MHRNSYSHSVPTSIRWIRLGKAQILSRASRFAASAPSGGPSTKLQSDAAFQSGWIGDRQPMRSGRNVLRFLHRAARFLKIAGKRSIADERAALVTYPISEAQVVHPLVVKSGVHRRRGT
jgi:hypothetical protein